MADILAFYARQATRWRGGLDNHTRSHLQQSLQLILRKAQKGSHHMKCWIQYLTAVVFCFGSAGKVLANTIEPLSGLPLAPGFSKTGDPIQSYTFCGKGARSVVYSGGDFPDLDHEVSWYVHAMPGAVVFTAIGGVKTLITADGTAAVELADAFISFFRFSPGLSPAEMKILGAAPAARACTPD
jgi:hypothetical protein